MHLPAYFSFDLEAVRERLGMRDTDRERDRDTLRDALTLLLDVTDVLTLLLDVTEALPLLLDVTEALPLLLDVTEALPLLLGVGDLLTLLEVVTLVLTVRLGLALLLPEALPLRVADVVLLRERVLLADSDLVGGPDGVREWVGVRVGVTETDLVPLGVTLWVRVREGVTPTLLVMASEAGWAAHWPVTTSHAAPVYGAWEVGWVGRAEVGPKGYQSWCNHEKSSRLFQQMGV
jgi:hypothetical protein